MRKIKNAVILGIASISMILISYNLNKPVEVSKSELLSTTAFAKTYEDTVLLEDVYSTVPVIDMQEAVKEIIKEDNDYLSDNFATELQTTVAAEEKAEALEKQRLLEEEAAQKAKEAEEAALKEQQDWSEKVNYYANNISQLANEDQNLYWMSKLIFAEAEGEPVEGQIAVGNVILNRVKSDKFPNSIYDVIFQKNQFSVVGGRLNYNPDLKAITSAYKVLYLNEKAEGMNDNVLYFRSDRASWWKGVNYWKTIGNHYFATQY